MTGKQLFAEDLPYWNSGSTLSSNQDRIERELRKFGAQAVMTTMGWNDDRSIWRIQFQYRGHVYRFEYEPWPTRGEGALKGKSRAQVAMDQMGARAYYEIKALLTAAAFDQERDVPRALFGFLELPARNGVALRASDLPTEELAQRLDLPALAARNQ